MSRSSSPHAGVKSDDLTITRLPAVSISTGGPIPDVEREVPRNDVAGHAFGLLAHVGTGRSEQRRVGLGVLVGHPLFALRDGVGGAPGDAQHSIGR